MIKDKWEHTFEDLEEKVEVTLELDEYQTHESYLVMVTKYYVDDSSREFVGRYSDYDQAFNAYNETIDRF